MTLISFLGGKKTVCCFREMDRYHGNLLWRGK